MKYIARNAAAAAVSLAVLAALAGCGQRVATTAQDDHPSVEINRHGEEGARRDTVDARPGPTAIMGAPGAATLAPDVRIAGDVRQAIAADPDLATMKIDVSSQAGAVTLRGHAPDPVARDRATDLARNVPDVKSVENQLTLG